MESRLKTSETVVQLTTNNDPVANNTNENCTNEEQLKNLGVFISNASAKWTDAYPENGLRSINLTIRLNELVAIIGPVGAGKVFINTISKVNH